MSATASAKGIKNFPTSVEVIDNIDKLIDQVLEPLRLKYGKPIHVTSGYRSVQLNKALGGVDNSYHIKGLAADIMGTPRTREESAKIYCLIKQMKLPVCELIAEDLDEKGLPLWVHVSV